MSQYPGKLKCSIMSIDLFLCAYIYIYTPLYLSIYSGIFIYLMFSTYFSDHSFQITIDSKLKQ